MGNGPQTTARSTDGTFRCTLTAPRAGLSGFPALATSFDRWGAILQLDAAQVASSAVELDDPVELDLMLPGHQSFGRRSMHCLGKAIQTSRDVKGQLWLVVRFHQLQIRPLIDGPVAVNGYASIQATGRGDRGCGAVE